MSKQSSSALALAALGIVYGDIGTSPLYAFEQVFSNGDHSVPISQANILGVLSVFMWSLVMIVTIKYVFFIMRADNQGEGGIISLMALSLEKAKNNATSQKWILGLGLTGAAFFYGDGVITPAISVLSAVEGLELISPKLKDLVLPVSIAILCFLFWSQRKGTATIGLFFGPVMLLWFVVIGLLGIWNIAQQPGVLLAINPLYALEFLSSHGFLSFFALGAVVLCLTGAEALYADMGHFGRRPIRIMWIRLVFPALLLNYFGQGALLLHQPSALDNLFYLMAPAFLHTPMIILATLATVIASQAVISGVFSMTRQAIRLGFLPRLQILQTSADEIGQIYLPLINYLLAAAVIGVILIFQTSNALGSAYGIAVTGTMLITDFLAISVAIKVWNWQPWRAILGAVAFVIIDSVFFSANALKFIDGGWMPVLLSLMVLIVLTTWNRGRLIVEDFIRAQATPLSEFITTEVTEETPRIDGTAIYLSSDLNKTPIALRKTLHHFNVIHKQVIILAISYELVSHVADESRVTTTHCDKGFMKVQFRFGFMEQVNIADMLKAHWPETLAKNLSPTSYFGNRLVIIQEGNRGMLAWRKRLFRFMYRNAQHPTDYLNVPVADSMSVSTRVII
ncbi:MAG: potassium transporter Kup [Sheuella sp.]|nr:potassium transporter Kup [Sheuella sp.]